MRTVRLVSVLLLPIAALFITTVSMAQSSAGHWVAVWGASPQAPMQFSGRPPVATYENQTVGLVVRPTIGGERLRIRFSNAFGSPALKISTAHIALVDSGAKIKGLS